MKCLMLLLSTVTAACIPMQAATTLKGDQPTGRAYYVCGNYKVVMESIPGPINDRMSINGPEAFESFVEIKDDGESVIFQSPESGTNVWISGLVRHPLQQIIYGVTLTSGGGSEGGVVANCVADTAHSSIHTETGAQAALNKSITCELGLWRQASELEDELVKSLGEAQVKLEDGARRELGQATAAPLRGAQVSTQKSGNTYSIRSTLFVDLHRVSYTQNLPASALAAVAFGDETGAVSSFDYTLPNGLPEAPNATFMRLACRRSML